MFKVPLVLTIAPCVLRCYRAAGAGDWPHVCDRGLADSGLNRPFLVGSSEVAERS